MPAMLNIRDEYFGTPAAGDPLLPSLQLASERVSPREIIRQRVFTEVAEINEARMEHSRGHQRTRSFLIRFEPEAPESRLNTPIVPKKSPLLDAEEEFARALKAFAANRFVMLFDECQVEGLDDELTVAPESEVTFLHLTPLRGG
jgi:hypothetical protein